MCMYWYSKGKHEGLQSIQGGLRKMAMSKEKIRKILERMISEDIIDVYCRI